MEDIDPKNPEHIKIIEDIKIMNDDIKKCSNFINKFAKEYEKFEENCSSDIFIIFLNLKKDIFKSETNILSDVISYESIEKKLDEINCEEDALDFFKKNPNFENLFILFLFMSQSRYAFEYDEYKIMKKIYDDHNKK